MTRRTRNPHVGEAGRRANRMAPGGRLYSESSIKWYTPSFGPDGSASTFAVTMDAEVEKTDVVIERFANDDVVAPGPYATLGLLAEPEPPAPEQH